MYHATTLEETTVRMGLASFVFLYLCMTLPFLGWLREIEHGRALLFMALGAAAMGDTAAMIAGKTIGGRKMSPLTSPNKTWAGFIAGFFGSVFAVWVVRMIAWRDLPLVHVLMLGVLVGLTGPLGDLIESMIKRDYHIKDSGTIIPGHGGILDRIDAQIFTGPAVFFYVKWFII
jgi:phosphatidate cytidylyltransferase